MNAIATRALIQLIAHEFVTGDEHGPDGAEVVDRPEPSDALHRELHSCFAGAAGEKVLDYS
jgi:hypothetical protein